VGRLVLDSQNVVDDLGGLGRQVGEHLVELPDGVSGAVLGEHPRVDGVGALAVGRRAVRQAPRRTLVTTEGLGT